MSRFSTALAECGLVGSHDDSAEGTPENEESGHLLSVSHGDYPKLTPGESQVCALKLAFPGTVLLVESGYRFRLYGSEAVFAARHLGIVAHLDRAGGGKLMAAGIPIHRLGVHVRRLVHGQGCVVAVVRQAETSAAKAAGLAVDGKKSGPFARALAGLYSPSTLAADDVVGGIETGATGSAFMGSAPSAMNSGAGRGGGRGRGGFWQAAARAAAARRGGGHSTARPASAVHAGRGDDDGGGDDGDEEDEVDASAAGAAADARFGAPSQVQSLAGNPLPLLVYVEGTVPSDDCLSIGATAQSDGEADVVHIDSDESSDTDMGSRASATQLSGSSTFRSRIRASALLSIDVASLAVQWDAWLWVDGPATVANSQLGTVAPDPQRIALASRLAGLGASEMVVAGSSNASSGNSSGAGFAVTLSNASAETLLKFASASSTAATAGDTAEAGSPSAAGGILGLGAVPSAADLAAAQLAAVQMSNMQGMDSSTPLAATAAGGNASKASLGKFAAAAAAKVTASRSSKKQSGGGAAASGSAALPTSALPFVCANPAIVSYAWQLPEHSPAGASGSAKAPIVLARSSDGLSVVTTGAEMRSANAASDGNWWDYDSGGGGMGSGTTGSSGGAENDADDADEEDVGSVAAHGSDALASMRMESRSNAFAKGSNTTARRGAATAASSAGPPVAKRARTAGPQATSAFASSFASSGGLAAKGTVTASSGSKIATPSLPQGPRAASLAVGKSSISHYFGGSGATGASGKASASPGATTTVEKRTIPSATAAISTPLVGLKRPRPSTELKADPLPLISKPAAAAAGEDDEVIVLDSSDDDDKEQLPADKGGSSKPTADPSVAVEQTDLSAPYAPTALTALNTSDTELSISSASGSAALLPAEAVDKSAAAEELSLTSQARRRTDAPPAAAKRAAANNRRPFASARVASAAASSLSPTALNVPVSAPPPPRPARMLVHVVPSVSVSVHAKQLVTAATGASALSTGLQSKAAGSAVPLAEAEISYAADAQAMQALSVAVAGAAETVGLTASDLAAVALRHAAAAAALFLLPFGEADALGRAMWTRMAAGAASQGRLAQAAASGAASSSSRTGDSTDSALHRLPAGASIAAESGSARREPDNATYRPSPPSHMLVTSATLSDIGVLPLRQSRADAAATAGASSALSSAAAAAGLVGLYDRFAATAAGRRVVADWLTRPLALGAAINARLSAVDALVGRRASLEPETTQRATSGPESRASSLPASTASVLRHTTLRQLAALAHVVLGRINSPLQPPLDYGDDDGGSGSGGGDGDQDGAGRHDDAEETPARSEVGESPAPRGISRRRVGRWGRMSGPPSPDLHALAGRLMQGRATPTQVATAFSWLSRLGNAMALLLPKSSSAGIATAAVAAASKPDEHDQICVCGSQPRGCSCAADPLRAAVEPILAAACLPISVSMNAAAATVPLERGGAGARGSSSSNDGDVISLDDDDDDLGLGSGYVAGPAAITAAGTTDSAASRLLRYLRSDSPLPGAILECLPGLTSSSLPSLASPTTGAKVVASGSSTVAPPSASASASAAGVDDHDDESAAGEHGGAAPALPLRADIAEALQPSLAHWRAQHAAANTGLVNELARVRKVLGKPSLQWTRLRTGINAVLECLVELKKTELDAGALRPLKVPSDWSEVSATKLVRRYRTPATAALLQQRELASDMITKDAAAAWTRWQRDVLGRYVVPQLLLPAAEGIARLDALAAFACVSGLPGYARPVVWDRDAALPFIRIHEGRHPVLEHAGRASVVATSAADSGINAAEQASADASGTGVIDDGAGSKGTRAGSSVSAGAGAGAAAGGGGFTYIPSSLALGPIPSAVSSSTATGAASDGVHDASAAESAAAACTDAEASVAPSCLTITGPNAAGKSMAARMLACLVVQAQAGSYVAAEGMQLSIVDALHTRMGSADSIVAGYSSFALEMRTAASMLASANDLRLPAATDAGSGAGGGAMVPETATAAAGSGAQIARSLANLPRPLLLFDELGRATSTRDGAAIATATLKYTARAWLQAGLPCYRAQTSEHAADGGDAELTDSRSSAPQFLPLCVFVTHFPQVAQLPRAVPAFSHVVGNAHPAFLIEGAESGDASASSTGSGSDGSGRGGDDSAGSVSRDKGQLTFLYRLADGAAPSSYGLAVARLAGLPAALVDRAEYFSRMHPGHSSSAAAAAGSTT